MLLGQDINQEFLLNTWLYKLLAGWDILVLFIGVILG